MVHLRNRPVNQATQAGYSLYVFGSRFQAYLGRSELIRGDYLRFGLFGTKINFKLYQIKYRV